MTWEELIREEIEKLEIEKESVKKRIDKSTDDIRKFEKNVGLMADVKSIQETITELYIILGRSGQEVEK